MNDIIKNLPKWALTSVTFIIVGYIGVLGYVAVKTERTVEFWPPKIGEGPKSAAVIKIVDLQSEINKFHLEFSEELNRLNTRLADARTSLASGAAYESAKETKWREVIASYERDIEKFEKNYIIHIKELENSVKSLKTELEKVELL